MSDTPHSTTIGPYLVERVVTGNVTQVRFTETWGDVAQVHDLWDADLARCQANVVRECAADPACDDPQREHRLADALERAAGQEVSR